MKSATVADSERPAPLEQAEQSRPRTRPRLFAGWLRATHVWLGLLTAVGVLAVSVTGILLNHSASFGWGQDGPPPVSGSGDLADAAPINDLLKAALTESVDRDVRVINELGAVSLASGPGDIERAVFRPRTSTAQVRMKDPVHTEVTLDWTTGEVLDVRARHDVRLDHLHSGEAFGQRAVIVTDVVATTLVILVIGGTAIWLRRLIRRRPAHGRRDGRLVRANWWFHLVGGLLAVTYTIVLSVTGVILNHKREWGFMDEPVGYVADEVIARSVPASVATIVSWAVDERTRRGDDVGADDVRLVDYRPGAGFAKVRFTDAETEVVVDAYEAEILTVSHRRDVWIEDLHSGVRFGANGWWLSDVTAGLLILLTLNGVYIWIRPAFKGRSRPIPGEVDP